LPQITSTDGYDIFDTITSLNNKKSHIKIF
jgi:hypothetical protein